MIRVRLRTAVGTYNSDAPSTGAGSWAVQWLRPEIRVTGLTPNPLTYAPYGPPPAANLALVMGIVALAVVFSVGVLVGVFIRR